MVIEGGSIRSHSVETWLWKMLWTSHTISYRVMMKRVQILTMMCLGRF